VKLREGWTWKRFLANKPSPVWEWWQQSITQGDEMECEPMLWFRHSREDWHVMMRAEYARKKRIAGKVLDGRAFGLPNPLLCKASLILNMHPQRFAKS
jgi:hypothetical protein